MKQLVKFLILKEYYNNNTEQKAQFKKNFKVS